MFTLRQAFQLYGEISGQIVIVDKSQVYFENKIQRNRLILCFLFGP